MAVEVILEQGINHNGDLAIAKKLIDVAHSAGCDYVKFQRRDIDLVYTKDELNKPRESPWGTTTREQKEGLEFGYKEYVEIDNYCKGKLFWFASPWDVNSVDFLMKFDVPFIKVPSALMTNESFLKKVKHTKVPLILSTGMSDLNILDNAIDIVGKDRVYAILHCTSTYPTAPDEINAKVIPVMKELYPSFKIGFSNHYAGLHAMEVAVAYGAEMIEFHGTLDRASYGSDQAASIEPRGVFELMERIRLIEKMKGDGVKRIYESEKPIAAKLRR
jgi:N-acetylneuraminate synthase